MVKDVTADTRDVGSIPGSGRFPGVGNDNPLQYACLGNPMDRGAWWAAVHRVTKSWARLSMCMPHMLSLHCIQVIFFNVCVHYHCTFYLDLEIHKLINQLNE